MTKVEDARLALDLLTQRQLSELLNTYPGVRAWLGGDDPNEPGAGATVTSKEAGELLGVERQRLWRWERAGKLARVATNNATPLYLRSDVMALQDEAEAGRRRRETAEA